MVIDHQKIILSRTGKGLSLRKIAGFVNVAFFWGVMLYLTRSLVLTVWGAADSLLFGGTSGLVDGNIARVFFLYLVFIIVASSALWSWAEYNRRRYGGKRDKRRVHPAALTLAQLCDYTGFPMEKLGQMRRAKVLVAHFDEARELNAMDSYASVEEKECLALIGLPPPAAKKLDLVMRLPESGALSFPAFDSSGGAGEEVSAEYYLDPSDSARLLLGFADGGGRAVILDVEAELVV